MCMETELHTCTRSQTRSHGRPSKSQREFIKGNTFTSPVCFSAPHARVHVCYVLFPLSVSCNNNNNSPVPCLSETDRVCDEQGVSGLSEVVSSGRLSSASASHRIRRGLRGELLFRPALSLPQKVLLQRLWTHLPSPCQSI